MRKRTNSSHSRPGAPPAAPSQMWSRGPAPGARGGAGVSPDSPSASLSHLDLGLISSMSLRCRLTRCQGQKRDRHKPQPHWSIFPATDQAPLLPPSGRPQAEAWRTLPVGRGAGRGPGLSAAYGVRGWTGPRSQRCLWGEGLDGAWGWTGPGSQRCLWGEGMCHLEEGWWRRGWRPCRREAERMATEAGGHGRGAGAAEPRKAA